MSLQYFDRVVEPTELLVTRFVTFLPTLVLVVLVLLIGVLASFLAARCIRWVLVRVGLDRLADRIGAGKALTRSGIDASASALLGRFTFWVGLLVTLFTAAEVAGASHLADAITSIVGYLPRALAAFVVLILGFRGARLARDLLSKTVEKREDLDTPEVVPKIGYWSVIALTVTQAADQAGLETALVNILIAIVGAGVCFGTALAFALAARRPLANIVARHYASQIIKPGDYVEFQDGHAGVVSRFRATGVELQVHSNLVYVPYEAILTGSVIVGSTPDP